MQTQLSPEYIDRLEGQEAQALLSKCVHCGFCLATCPTYQLVGDELDSPRGRIYQIKSVLEGDEPTADTQLHLDRCLGCRNCETTCPSGVEYGKILDIGRKLVEERVARSIPQKALRWLLKEGLNSRWFAPAMRLGQYVRPILPSALQAKVPAYHAAGSKPKEAHQRKVLMLAGCVQPAMMPNINGATRRLLDTLGIQTLEAKTAGCCGAVKFHLNDQEAATQQMRVNIDAWWPSIENQQIEAIVMNASGCGVMVKDYGHLLAGDEAYAEKAKRVSALTKDLSEFLAERCTNTDSWARLHDKLKAKTLPRLVYHPPCTLQHGQKLRGGVEQIMLGLGFELTLAAQEAHLCCGSAGTYSVLQPLLAHRLKERKLEQLLAQTPGCIVSANIGCISHLQSGTNVPVRHWVEVLDEALGR